MSLFRGSRTATTSEGQIVATAQDVIDAVNDAIAAKNSAESAEEAALNILDDFGDRYLGAKTSDPSTDNDGDPLIDGALYFNTSEATTKVYDNSSSSWLTLKISQSDQDKINEVADISSEVENVSNNLVYVKTVSDDITGPNTLGAVAPEINNVAAVGLNISDVVAVSTNLSGPDTISTVAGSISDVQTVSTNISDVNTVADNIVTIQDAPQSASDAEDAQGYAEEWAINPEDTPVSVDAGGDGTNDFSSLHHAAKASASASSASTSESNALTSEQNAATSESNALTSEQNASQSESNAATSEQNAQQAATDAETALDNFTDQYLGPKALEPTTDNDGDPLVTGALYYNTTADQLEIWNGTEWDPAAFSTSGTVVSFNGRDGAVVLQSSDVTDALGFTPQDEETEFATPSQAIAFSIIFGS